MLLPVIDYANHPAYAPLLEDISATERSETMAAYQRQAVQAKRNLERFRPHWGSPARTGNPNGSPVYEPMIRDGFSALKFPTELKAKALELGMPHFNAMRARIERDPDRAASHLSSKLNLDDIIGTEYASLLGATLKKFGIMPAVSSYLGMPNIAVKQLQFKIASAQWLDEADPCPAFPDLEDLSPATDQFHVDAPACDIKMIVYLSEVTEPAHGPFRYVPGTQTNPYQSIDEFALRVSTITFAGDRSREGRRRLMALPEMYRQRIDFGADLDQEGVLARDLLEREKVFYSNECDAILFDTKGVHRGGMIARGERLIMQATLQGMAY